jgi:hypothetical protein
MEYEHTQRSPWMAILGVLAVVALTSAILVWGEPEAFAFLALAAVIAIVSLMIGTLTVFDAGEHLQMRYGPLPLMHWKVRYDKIRSVEASRSTLLDGWGIHWVPGRGWTVNLWGFECVLVELEGGRQLRIGTDDVEGLVAFLERRI